MWIEQVPKLEPLAKLLSAQAELVKSLSVANGVGYEIEVQVAKDSAALSEMVRKQLEDYGLGKGR